MYAVFKAGGHQYRAKAGDIIEMDKVVGSVGDVVEFKEVLLVGDKEVKVGAPVVEGASVEATIKEHKRQDKIIVFKYKRRKNYKRTRGHKQPVTVVEVKSIKSK
tara:strand:- start:56 stop:367 length:312 start_codon:yes stop_codon:yes gene_type:complete